MKILWEEHRFRALTTFSMVNSSFFEARILDFGALWKAVLMWNTVVYFLMDVKEEIYHLTIRVVVGVISYPKMIAKLP